MKAKIYAIIITNKCNLKCKYCYSGNLIENKEMNLEVAEKVCKHILGDIKKNEIQEVQIIFEGNEPLLNFSILKYIKENLKLNFKNKRIDFTIFTNLQWMNSEILEYIKKNNVYVHTSLDGNKEIHDLYRGNGTFDKTVFWIKKCFEEGISVNASATICANSLNKFKEILDTYVSLGLKSINMRYLHNLGLAKENEDILSYTPEKFLDFYKNAFNYILHLNLNGKEIMDQKAVFILNKINHRTNKTNLYSPPCTGIKKQILYDPSGDIYTCDEGRNNPSVHKIGNVESGIDEKLQEMFFYNAGESENSCANCRVSEFCGPCIALNSPINVNCIERCFVTKELFDFISDTMKDEKKLSILEKY
jgi:radical SAM protein with 4Fe4S-binding SPASM domain